MTSNPLACWRSIEVMGKNPSSSHHKFAHWQSYRTVEYIEICVCSGDVNRSWVVLPWTHLLHNRHSTCCGVGYNTTHISHILHSNPGDQVVSSRGFLQFGPDSRSLFRRMFSTPDCFAEKKRSRETVERRQHVVAVMYKFCSDQTIVWWRKILALGLLNLMPANRHHKIEGIRPSLFPERWATHFFYWNFSVFSLHSISKIK